MREATHAILIGLFSDKWNQEVRYETKQRRCGPFALRDAAPVSMSASSGIPPERLQAEKPFIKTLISSWPSVVFTSRSVSLGPDPKTLLAHTCFTNSLAQK